MENLDKAFENATYNDIKPVVVDDPSISHLVEPTKEEILSVVAMLKENKSIKEIWKTVRVGEQKQFCLSKEQIAQIKQRWEFEVAKLAPAPPALPGLLGEG